MFTRIVAAIDGSPVSKKALEYAIDEAKAWNSDLHAVYVIETGMLSSIPMDNTLEVIYALLENEGKETLEYARNLAATAGITIMTHIKQGHAGNEILSLAESEKADLIVLGSHGKTEIDRFLLGSVTTYVVRHSNITTMVVRS
ncbi:MAG: universal stress protein [Methanomicrobiaceae archaeon]|nr:universal stress protein [Methanomicrobiaceae archaeon]